MASRHHPGSIVGGAILIIVGLLALLGEIFQSYNFWGYLWPLIVLAVGVIFFVGALIGGKSSAGLAIPGSIISVIGLILFFQNLTNHWESWSYAWTLILMGVGAGVFISGLISNDEKQRRSGLRLVGTGGILFIIFGAFFEMIFNAFNGAAYIFPVVLILVGGYLVIKRAGLFTNPRHESLNPPDESNQEMK
jgi:hypothetical protein